jgi:dienelactone hydrolase
MSKRGMAGLALLLASAAVFGQADIPLSDAGTVQRERSGVATSFAASPSLVVEGWEKARLGTVEYSGNVKTDLYFPAELTDKAPPIILVAFSYTSAQFIETYGISFRQFPAITIWMAELANRGFMVVCPDITSSGKDMAAMLAWLVGNGARLGADPLRIGLISFSANPKIIPYLLTLPEAPLIKAIALYYPDLVPSAWPAPSGIALHIINAGQDPAISRQKADLVARKFADAGNFVEVFTYEKGAHAFDLKDRSPEAATMMAKTLDFFSNYLR